jgi:two-component system, cell cycle sensor histidine kinase and response regulator CckA
MQTTGSNAGLYLLVVEDDPVLGSHLEEYFNLLGHRVVHAESGAEALHRVMESDFDAVICDMVMPRMAGNMFYLAVQRVKPRLCERFVFITGHGESPGVREFLSGVGERVFAKPFNLEDLAEAVRLTVAEAGDTGRRIEAP